MGRRPSNSSNFKALLFAPVVFAPTILALAFLAWEVQINASDYMSAVRRLCRNGSLPLYVASDSRAAIGALEGAGALAGAFGAGAGPQPSSWERQTMTVLSAPPEASNSPFVDIPENAHAAAPPAWPSSV